MMRQILDVEETILNQVLYVGNKHKDSPGDVFLFFKEMTGHNEESFMVNHAIINPDCTTSCSRLIQNNCQITIIGDGSVLEDYVKTLNDESLSM